MAQYQKSIELEPKFAPAYNNWGMALLSQNMYDDAIAQFEQETALDPKFAKGIQQLGDGAAFAK